MAVAALRPVAMAASWKPFGNVAGARRSSKVSRNGRYLQVRALPARRRTGTRLRGFIDEFSSREGGRSVARRLKDLPHLQRLQSLCRYAKPRLSFRAKTCAAGRTASPSASARGGCGKK